MFKKGIRMRTRFSTTPDLRQKMASKQPNSPKNASKKSPRPSSSLLRLDMRLPGRVKAELKPGPGGLKGGRAVKEFVEKVLNWGENTHAHFT